MSYYTATFLVGAHRFGVLSPKLQKFSEIFWALHIDHINTKDDIRNFCLFVYLRSYNEYYKSISNIPLYIGKNPVEKLCEVLEMEPKMYTPVSLKFFFENGKIMQGFRNGM